MAIKLPSFQSTGMDAKSRVFIIFIVVAAVALAIFLGSRYLSGPKNVVGGSRVANAPRNLQSVPGSQLNPEYQQALLKENAQAAKQASMTGGSAVPTLMNFGGQQQTFQPQQNCNVMCNEQKVDVANTISDLLKSNKIDQKTAALLNDLAKNNVPVSEYEDELDQLVREGKISPEDARRLLEDYKKQHENALLDESAKTLDGFVKSGQMSLNTANQLLALQKSGITPAEYAAALQQLVKEGKISPQVAAQLLSQYTQQQAKQAEQQGAYELQKLAKSGAITPDVAADLAQMQKNNVPVDQYAAELQKLVSEGKITPAEAEKLLNEYKAQRVQLGASTALSDLATAQQAAADQQISDMVQSGKISKETGAALLALQNKSVSPDSYNLAADAEAAAKQDIADLVASGAISKETGDALLALQNKHVSPAEYQAALNELVKEGKLTPDQARALMASYNKLSAVETAADQLAALRAKHVSPEEYQAALDALVKAGKITPEQAAMMMLQYKHVPPSQYAAAIADMVKSGRLSPDEAAALASQLQSKHLTPEEYAAQLDELVKEGKITPEEAKELLDNYKKLALTRSVADQLGRLQANNATPAEYAAALKAAVISGALTPEQAASLMQEYQAMTTPVNTPIAVNNALPSTSDFAKLQKTVQATQLQLQTAAPAENPQYAATQFSAAQAQAQSKADEARLQRIQTIEATMSSQAQSLLVAWQPPKMAHVAGTPEKKKEATSASSGGAFGSASGGGKLGETSPPLLKAGSIAFAVLDTAVDSDYPDTPVMVTIVDGPLKGAKMLGKLTLASGQDKVSLNFTMMSRDDWNKNKSVNAFAIDPDTARTVMASSVDNHYWLRYGSIMATSFLQGYSSGITQAGTSSSGGFFTSSTHPELSPGNKLAVGLGQIGTTMSNITQNYVNTPATVKVNSGVGLGILFMSDVNSSDTEMGIGGATTLSLPSIGTKSPA